MGAGQSNDGVAQPAAPRRNPPRRRDNHRSYFLIFGEPRVKYTGEGRGPLLFHVATPAPETENVVDSAATFRCPVSICGITRTRAANAVAFDVRIRALADCKARAHVGGSVEVQRDHGVTLVGSSPLGTSSDVQADPDEVKALSFSCTEAQWSAAATDESGVDPSKKHFYAANALCVAFEFEVMEECEVETQEALDAADERPLPNTRTVPCTMYFLFRADTADSPDATRVLPAGVLLQRGVCVFKLETVFEMGRDTTKQERGDGDADEDDDDESDDGDGVCVVCIDNPKDTIVLPCRHMCMCSECAQAVRNQRGKCPMCRTDIERLMKRS